MLSGIAILPTSCSSPVRSVSSICSGSVHLAGDVTGERADVEHVLGQLGLLDDRFRLLGDRRQQHVAHLGGDRRRAAAVLGGIHPAVGGVQRGRHVSCLGRERDGSSRRQDRERGPMLRQRGRAQLADLVGAQRAPRHERAELIAAEPVRTTGRRQRLLQLPCQPDQELIAGRVSERVVVALEAVRSHQPRPSTGSVARAFGATDRFVAQLMRRMHSFFPCTGQGL
jgi:hypothetical protein